MRERIPDSVRRVAKPVGVVLLVVLAFSAGHVVASYPVEEYAESYTSPSHPYSDVPSHVDATKLDSGDVPPATFCRPEADTQVFSYQSHDPMLVQEGDTYFAIVGTSTDQSLYRTQTPRDRDSWELVNADYFNDRFELDSLVEVNGTYVVYGNNNVYTASSVLPDTWTKENDNTGFRDLGAYYDEEEGLVHLYYEYGNAAGLSGKKIGHAVSPNGVDNWTVYPPVWTAPEGYGVGDFDIVETDGTIYIFGDYDPQHPRYNVSVWANDDPYSEFTQLDQHALTHRLGNTAYADDYGVGDPSITELPNGEYLMLANGYASESSVATLHYYVGTIGNATDGPSTCSASATAN